jgi:excisionase family DNA binding protein
MFMDFMDRFLKRAASSAQVPPNLPRRADHHFALVGGWVGEADVKQAPSTKAPRRRKLSYASDISDLRVILGLHSFPTFCHNSRLMPIPVSLPSPDTRWYSVIEVAAHLGVAPDTVYRWIEKKKLPALRVGRLWKCKLAEVDTWVRAGGPAEDPGAPVERRTPRRGKRVGVARKRV